MNTTITENNKNLYKKMKLDFKDSNYATGRRKRSIARVWIKKGSGKIYVNGKEMNQYFKRPVHQLIVVMPLQETNVINQFDVKGLSRALVQADGSLKKILKKNKLTTRDSRKVERKKYGHRKARRSFQFSKR